MLRKQSVIEYNFLMSVLNNSCAEIYLLCQAPNEILDLVDDHQCTRRDKPDYRLCMNIIAPTIESESGQVFLSNDHFVGNTRVRG